MEIYFIASIVFFIASYFIYIGLLENRHVQYYEGLKVKHVFHCKQCSKVYNGNQEVCKCPECGKENSYLRF